MKKYVFCNYFRDSNQERAKEYLACVYANLNLNWVEAVYIFLEDPEHEADISHPKARFKLLERRLEFADVMQEAQTLEPNSLVCIVNLDIYLAESAAWKNIDRDFFAIGHEQKAMVCTRHNINADGTTWIEEKNWLEGNFCDAWIMRTPLNPRFLKEDLKFCVGGAPQCDNTMMYIMSKYYHVYSWGEKYEVFHLDLCRKNNGQSQMITNASTDWRPSKRKNEHIRIPARQDWERMLITGERPQSFPCYKNISLKI